MGFSVMIMIKVVIGMKRSEWGSVVEFDEYVVKVLVYELKFKVRI